MSTTFFTADQEIIELFADDPELLALTEAIVATQTAAEPVMLSRPAPLGTVRRLGGRALLVAGLVVALAAVFASLALGRNPLDLFTGGPPTPIVKEHFDEVNGIAKRLNAAPPNGLSLPLLDVTSARGVLSVQTGDGPLNLWAASGANGSTCWLIQIVNDPNPNDTLYGPSVCLVKPPTSGIFWEHSPNENLPSLKFLVGYTVGDAAAVAVRFADDSSQEIPVIEHFFLATTDMSATVTKITAYDANGQPLAESSSQDQPRRSP